MNIGRDLITNIVLESEALGSGSEGDTNAIRFFDTHERLFSKL